MENIDIRFSQNDGSEYNSLTLNENSENTTITENSSDIYKQFSYNFSQSDSASQNIETQINQNLTQKSQNIESQVPRKLTEIDPETSNSQCSQYFSANPSLVVPTQSESNNQDSEETVVDGILNNAENNSTNDLSPNDIKIISDTLNLALNCIKNGKNLNISNDKSKVKLKIESGRISLDLSIGTFCKFCEKRQNNDNIINNVDKILQNVNQSNPLNNKETSNKKPTIIESRIISANEKVNKFIQENQKNALKPKGSDKSDSPKEPEINGLQESQISNTNQNLKKHVRAPAVFPTAYLQPLNKVNNIPITQNNLENNLNLCTTQNNKSTTDNNENRCEQTSSNSQQMDKSHKQTKTQSSGSSQEIIFEELDKSSSKEKDTEPESTKSSSKNSSQAKTDETNNTHNNSILNCVNDISKYIDLNESIEVQNTLEQDSQIPLNQLKLKENNKNQSNNAEKNESSIVYNVMNNKEKRSIKKIKLCTQNEHELSAPGCSKNLDESEVTNEHCSSRSNLSKSKSDKKKRKLSDRSDFELTESSEEDEPEKSCLIPFSRTKRKCNINKCPLEPKEHEKHGVIQQHLYSKFEEECMLRYLVKNQSITRAKGLAVWNEMIDKGYMKHRTPQSLLNNFRRKILTNLDNYNLPLTIKTQFDHLRS